MPSNYFECCPCVNPMDSVPEALSNIVKYNKKQDVEIEKRVNEDALSKVAKSGRYGDLIDKPVALPNPQPITINGQRYDGSEAVTVTVSSEGGGTPVEIDDTLTQSGKAADAKVVGDQLSALNEANAAQNTEIAKKANDADLARVAKSGSYDDLTGKPTIPTVPESLKNPNKLILSGAVSAEYDGSSEVSVEIPAGGSSAYELPVASATQLGGVMPVAKTDDMTQAVGVDALGGLWALPGGGASGETWEEIQHITTTEQVKEVVFSGFELKKAHLVLKTRMIKTDEPNKTGYSTLYIKANSKNMIPYNGNNMSAWNVFLPAQVFLTINNGYVDVRAYSMDANKVMTLTAAQELVQLDSFTKISVEVDYNSSGLHKFVVGSEFILYGVRV